MQKIRLFVSSPTDVAAERRRVDNVVNRLKLDYEGVEFEVIRWEEAFYTARSTFQDQIASPADVDVVLCILWKRLGSPLPDDYQREDGSTPTGTEYEFETAMEAALSGELPDILVYRKTASISFTAEHVEQEQAELQSLESFWRRWIQNEKGHFTAGFKPFENTDEFEQQLEKDLRAWLKRRFHHVTWPESKGSPYRGLDVFDEEHAAIYFGRRRAINEVRARLLANQQRDGIGFLLIIGASGAGKSSLVRAGLIPALKETNPIDGVTGWRTLVLRPAELGTDPVHGLVSQLYEHNVLPELAQGDYSQPRELSELWKSSPSMAAKPVDSALKRWGKILAEQEQMTDTADTRLLITIDQFEELFQFDTEQQIAFLNVIDSLSRSGKIWIIATMRSDFYPQLFSLPELMSLKDASRQYDLSIPRPHELQEIIAGPAKAAGLTFEQDNHAEGLEQRLLEDAEGNPGALPLLEFTLERLYQERDRENKQLTFKAYEQLGGLEGALTQTAEEAFTAIQKSFNDQPEAIFARVMRELVAIDEQGKATRRVAQLTRFSDNSDDKLLIDTLLNSRLLTGYTAEISGSEQPEAVVNITHEALIHHWDRVQQWLEQDQELLQVRERIDQDCQRWLNEIKRRDMLATSGKRLEDIRYLKTSGLQLEADTAEFIDASLIRTKQLQKRKRILQASFSAISIAAAFFGVITLNSLDELATQRYEVREQKQILIKSKADSTALIAETEFAKASLLNKQNNSTEALKSYFKAINNARVSGDIRRGKVAADEEQRDNEKNKVYADWITDTFRQPTWGLENLTEENKLVSGRSFYPILSPDKKTVLIIHRGEDTNYATLLRVADKKRLAGPIVTNIRIRPFNTSGASFSPNSKSLALIVENKAGKKSRYDESYLIKVIDTASGEFRDFSLDGIDHIPLLGFINDNSLLVSDNVNKSLRLWNINQNNSIIHLEKTIFDDDLAINDIEVINEKLLLTNNKTLWQQQSDRKWEIITILDDVNPFDSATIAPSPIITDKGFINVVGRYDSWLPDWFLNIASIAILGNYDPDSFISNWIKIQIRPRIAITNLINNKAETRYLDTPLPDSLRTSTKTFLYSFGILKKQNNDDSIMFLSSFITHLGNDDTYLYNLKLNEDINDSKPRKLLSGKSYDFKLITGIARINDHQILLSASNGELDSYDETTGKITTLRPSSNILGMIELDKKIILSSDDGSFVIDKSAIDNNDNLNLSETSKKLFSKYQYIYGKESRSGLFPKIYFDNKAGSLQVNHKEVSKKNRRREADSPVQLIKGDREYLEKIGILNSDTSLNDNPESILASINNKNVLSKMVDLSTVEKIAVSKTHIATTHTNNSINIISLDDKKPISFRTNIKDKTNTSFISSLQWHPSSPLLAVGNWSGNIYLLPAHKSGKTITKSSSKNQAAITQLRWSPDGSLLASGDRNGNVILWDASDNKTPVTLPHDSAIGAIDFSSNGQWLVTATDTDKLYFWRANGKRIGEPLQLDNIQVQNIIVNNDGWGVTIIDKSNDIYFVEAGDRFIPDSIVDYFDLFAQNELFNQRASKQKAIDRSSLLDYYKNPAKEDRSYWTAMINALIACKQHRQCSSSESIDQYFSAQVTDNE